MKRCGGAAIYARPELAEEPRGIANRDERASARMNVPPFENREEPALSEVERVAQPQW